MVLVGLPIVTAGFGEEGLLPLFVLISLHSAIMFSLTMMMVESGSGNGGSKWKIMLQTFRNLIRNPLIISLVLGLGFNLLKLSLPVLIDDVLVTLGKTAVPCSLFALGASMTRFKLTGNLGEAWTIIGLKIIVQPLLVWVLAFQVFHLDPLWGAVAVVIAGMPVGVNTFILGQKFQAKIGPISSAILLSTMLTVVTQTILLAIFVDKV